VKQAEIKAGMQEKSVGFCERGSKVYLLVLDEAEVETEEMVAPDWSPPSGRYGSRVGSGMVEHLTHCIGGMMADATLSAADRAKLEQRRDRLMKLMKESDGSGGGEQLDADDRADLAEEWTKIDKLLQGSR